MKKEPVSGGEEGGQGYNSRRRGERNTGKAWRIIG